MRTTKEAKKKWHDLFSLTKKKESERRRLAKGTGGGPPPPADLSGWEKKVKYRPKTIND